MNAITFYSYKGGVGRTLLVANTAQLLASFGKRVFALDLDLEAPGLHYKFRSEKSGSAIPGVVELLGSFLEQGNFPASLRGYVDSTVPVRGDGAIHVMRAGAAPTGDYWRTMGKIDWHGLFFGEELVGVPFFLELKARIVREFRPDYLLIDARTGITDMGGLATTVLSDTVVCLALPSAEHLEGLTAAMRGMRLAGHRHADNPLRVVPVISRWRTREDGAVEQRDLAEVLALAESLQSSIGPAGEKQEFSVLHAEPQLEFKEALLTDGNYSPSDTPLLRDYLKLFFRLVPAEEIRPHVRPLIDRAKANLLDDPDAAQSDLEALAEVCPDLEVFRTLLKVYQLRKASREKVLRAAALMWELHSGGGAPDSAIIEIVSSVYADPRLEELQVKFADFAEAVWRAAGTTDFKVALTLANVFSRLQRSRAIRLLEDYIRQADDPHPLVLARLINLYRPAAMISSAEALIERYKARASAGVFHIAWARLVLETGDRGRAKDLLGDPQFRKSEVSEAEPAVYYQLLLQAQDEQSDRFLVEAVARNASNPDPEPLLNLGRLMAERGRIQELEGILQGRMPSDEIETLLRRIRLASRRRIS